MYIFRQTSNMDPNIVLKRMIRLFNMVLKTLSCIVSEEMFTCKTVALEIKQRPWYLFRSKICKTKKIPFCLLSKGAFQVTQDWTSVWQPFLTDKSFFLTVKLCLQDETERIRFFYYKISLMFSADENVLWG